MGHSDLLKLFYAFDSRVLQACFDHSCNVMTLRGTAGARPKCLAKTNTRVVLAWHCVGSVFGRTGPSQAPIGVKSSPAERKAGHCSDSRVLTFCIGDADRFVS